MVRELVMGWLIGPFFDPKLCEFIYFCGNYFCRISFTQFWFLLILWHSLHNLVLLALFGCTFWQRCERDCCKIRLTKYCQFFEKLQSPRGCFDQSNQATLTILIINFFKQLWNGFWLWISTQTSGFVESPNLFDSSILLCHVFSSESESNQKTPWLKHNYTFQWLEIIVLKQSSVILCACLIYYHSAKHQLFNLPANVSYICYDFFT